MVPLEVQLWVTQFYHFKTVPMEYECIPPRMKGPREGKASGKEKASQNEGFTKKRSPAEWNFWQRVIRHHTGQHLAVM